VGRVYGPNGEVNEMGEEFAGEVNRRVVGSLVEMISGGVGVLLGGV